MQAYYRNLGEKGKIEKKFHSLYCLRRTVMQMLRDRGYLVGDFEISMTQEEFRDKFGEEPQRSDLTMVKSLRADPSKQIYVFFVEESRLGINGLKIYIQRMKTENVFRAILVVQEQPTSFAKQFLAEECSSKRSASKYHIETFLDSELKMNITKHESVPVHEPLTAEEKKALLEKYTLEETQLPRIQEMDPVARYYGLMPGQVVKIKRESETAGKYITYRLVTL